MNDQDLRELLTQLHARLTDARSLDSEDRKLLGTVLGDISRVLARSDASAPPAKPRLEALAVKFEADHPALADSLRQLVDLLGKAGI
jgi:hypothetical protein